MSRLALALLLLAAAASVAAGEQFKHCYSALRCRATSPLARDMDAKNAEVRCTASSADGSFKVTRSFPLGARKKTGSSEFTWEADGACFREKLPKKVAARDVSVVCHVMPAGAGANAQPFLDNSSPAVTFGGERAEMVHSFSVKEKSVKCTWS